MIGTWPFNYVVLFNHVRDELKTYLYYYNIYGHQTRQGGDIP